MTAAAWGLLVLTWSVIVYFTARFFWRVMTLPGSGGGGDADVTPPRGSAR